MVDLIKTKKVAAKDFLKIWEGRIVNNKNPYNQIQLLTLLDLLIKNSGINFSMEIFAGGSVGGASLDNDFSSSYTAVRNQFLNKLLFVLHNSKTNQIVKEKVLELFEVWHILFEKYANLNHNINKIHDNLKQEGIFQFPQIDNRIIFNEKFMESAVPPVWVEADSCMIGFETFTTFNRKHHCRNCGGVFCGLHSGNSISIPNLGLNEPVRVCDSCFELLTEKKHVKAKPSKYLDEENEMLKRALELSLKESQDTRANYVGGKTEGDAVNSYVVEEDDEEMRAAIAASMKDLEAKKHQAGPEPANSVPQPSPFEPLLNRELQSKVTPTEEDSINLFSQLMNNLKQQQFNGHVPDQVLQNQQLQGLYTEIIKLKTKLARNLNEDLEKYEHFIDLQQKLGLISRLYDNLLEKRLSLRGYNRGLSQPVQPAYTGQPVQPTYTGQQVPPTYTGQPAQPTYGQPNFSYSQQPPIPSQVTEQYTGQPNITPQFTQQPVYPQPTFQQPALSTVAEITDPQTAPQVQPSAPSEPPAGPAETQSPPQTSNTAPSAPANQVPSAPGNIEYSAPPVSSLYQYPQNTTGYSTFANLFPTAPTKKLEEPKEERMLIEL